MYKAVTVWLTSVTAVLQCELEARNSKKALLGLSDSAFFTITIVDKAIFMIFDCIMIVH